MERVRRLLVNAIENKTIDELCDLGLSLIRSGVLYGDDKKISHGIEYLINAYYNGDSEAAAWVGLLLYRGLLGAASGNSEDKAATILRNAALRGNLTARVFLNKLCAERYEGLISKRSGESGPVSGPLVDFDGRRITINKSGKRFPVDAVLEYRDGMNKLTFSVNLLLVYDELSSPSEFKNAVIRGIKEWEGIYRVFGGQTLQIAVNITTDDRLFDSVYVVAVTPAVASLCQKMPGFLKTEAGKKTMDGLFIQKRSLASIGFSKWSARSRKFIFIASKDDEFDDYNDIEGITKHEFGHVLGLGDLYESASDQLHGVKKGTYSELDGYYISNLVYNLVMCDHNGPISNNDIEMVVLAFSDDEAQLYQKSGNKKEKGKVSKALGKGN